MEMRPRAASPAVSVGLPVFNGANFLEEAICSILSQTLGDLELVICDNASTDATPGICGNYARLDPRVRYVRNDRNLGAVPNFNLTVTHARGRYFKWLAHDDRLKPTYLAATVPALDAHPDAVLCNTIVDYIDAAGEPIAIYDSGLSAADDADPARRFAAIISRSHSCVDVFGLVRRDAMPGPLPSFHGADRAFLAHMALRGRLIQLPDPLVQQREHPHRYTRQQTTATGRLAWHDTSRVRRLNFPTLRLYAEYARMVRSEPLSPDQRAKCYGALVQWWFRNWNGARLGVDLLSAFSPGMVGFAESLKTRLFGAAPGHYVKRSRTRG